MEKELEQKIVTSVPVKIVELPNSDFNKKQKNNYVTHAKLKMFYIGETGDSRIFTEDFSNKVIKTLPMSPVVGYYDEDSEDFKAHNSKQYVYGYVPENAEISFSEEDGQTWATTDVILFTGRKDNVGDVASKILGRQHSLELDPDTVEYKINRDNNGNFKSVEFIDASFIGLSVVGDSEKPAFSGSHFFTEDEQEQMLNAFINFKTSIGEYFNEDERWGGVKMDKFKEKFGEDFLLNLKNFMKESYQEKIEGLYDALQSSFADEYYQPVQADEGTVVVYDYYTGDFLRIDYKVNEEEEDKTYSFGEPEKVKPRYLTQDEIDNTFTEEKEGKEEKPNKIENSDFEENPDEGESEEEETEPKEAGADVDENFSKDVESTETDKADAKEGDVDNNEEAEEKEKTTFSKSEQKQLEKDLAELQSFRRQKKEAIVEEFVGLVEEDEIKTIKEKLDDFSYEEIEKELSYAAMKKIREEKKQELNNNADVTPFRLSGQDGSTGNKVDDMVEMFKDKK